MGKWKVIVTSPSDGHIVRERVFLNKKKATKYVEDMETGTFTCNFFYELKELKGVEGKL